MPIPPQVIKVFQYVDSNGPRMVEDLKEIVAIPSVTGDPAHKDDIIRAVKWCEKWFTRLKIKFERFNVGMYRDEAGDTVRLPPVVLGDLGKDPTKKTLCIYAHLDVIEVESSEWTSDPWKLTERDRALYGRGAARNKGPLICWFHAIMAYQTQRMPLPVNIKFIVCSTHERSCLGLENLLYTQRIAFLRTVDYVVVNGSEWLTATLPCLTYGAVGVAHLEVVATLKQASSGFDVRKEAYELSSCFGDENRQVLIPEVFQDVAQITPDEERAYEGITCKLDDLRPTLRPSMRNWTKSRILMHYWRTPCIVFNETEDCNCSTKDATPSAVRRFMMKLVPHQTPEKVMPQVLSHFKRVCEARYPNHELTFKKDGAEGIICNVATSEGAEPVLIVRNKVLTCTRPWLEDTSSPNFEAARMATREVYKDDASLIRLCRDMSIVLILQRLMHKSTLMIPLANCDCNMRVANENITLRSFIEGTKVLGAYIHHLGALTASKDKTKK